MFDFNGIDTRLQCRKAESSLIVRSQIPRRLCLIVDERDSGAGDDAAICIRDRGPY